MAGQGTRARRIPGAIQLGAGRPPPNTKVRQRDEANEGLQLSAWQPSFKLTARSNPTKKTADFGRGCVKTQKYHQDLIILD